jgi:hypothetical protein
MMSFIRCFKILNLKKHKLTKHLYPNLRLMGRTILNNKSHYFGYGFLGIDLSEIQKHPEYEYLKNYSAIVS